MHQICIHTPTGFDRDRSNIVGKRKKCFHLSIFVDLPFQSRPQILEYIQIPLT